MRGFSDPKDLTGLKCSDRAPQCTIKRVTTNVDEATLMVAMCIGRAYRRERLSVAVETIRRRGASCRGRAPHHLDVVLLAAHDSAQVGCGGGSGGGEVQVERPETVFNSFPRVVPRSQSCLPSGLLTSEWHVCGCAGSRPTQALSFHLLATPLFILRYHTVIFFRLGFLPLRKRRFCFTYPEKNGFVTATKLGTTNTFFVAATKNFAAATIRVVDRTKHFVVATKYFCYPYFNKLFCWCNKTFYTVYKVIC